MEKRRTSHSKSREGWALRNSDQESGGRLEREDSAPPAGGTDRCALLARKETDSDPAVKHRDTETEEVLCRVRAAWGRRAGTLCY